MRIDGCESGIGRWNLGRQGVYEVVESEVSLISLATTARFSASGESIKGGGLGVVE